jgi:hypothetical protein
MSESLRDQLLKAGLVSEKQARQAERESGQQKYRQGKRPKKDRAARAQSAPDPGLAAKAERDRELNRRRQQRAEAKARESELRQLLDQLRLPKPESDDYFNFVDGGKVRRVPVDPALRGQIVRGEVLLARCAGRYELLPATSADRVRERHADALVPLESQTGAQTENEDWYKGFEVPDDLVW